MTEKKQVDKAVFSERDYTGPYPVAPARLYIPRIKWTRRLLKLTLPDALRWVKTNYDCYTGADHT